MVHETDDGTFVVSSHQVWLPGSYATKQAAQYALQFPDKILQSLTDRICHVSGEDRPITTEDLRAAMPPKGTPLPWGVPR